MVVDNSFAYSGASNPDVNKVNYVSRRFVMTQEAAEQAVAIGDRIVAEGDWQEGKDDRGEQALFIALQTCVFQATRQPSRTDLRQIWVQRRKVIRDYIVQRHLGLACSTLGRFRTSHVDRDDLRSEAFFALVRAADGFDPWRGYRFSTYACNAITRALIQETTLTNRYRRRFFVGYDDFEKRPERANGLLELYVDRLHRILERNSARLTSQERAVLARRFPADGQRQQTLAKIGCSLGLGKESVRRIQNQGLGKIRKVLQADVAVLETSKCVSAHPAHA